MKYISRSVCYLVEISPAKSSLKTRPHHVCARETLKSKVIHKGPRLSFELFFVLCSEDCWFSVHCGCRGGMRHHTHLCDSSRVHKMVATTTSRHIISASHEPSQFTVDLHKPSHVTVDLHKPSQVTSLHKCFKRKGQIKNSIHFEPCLFQKVKYLCHQIT